MNSHTSPDQYLENHDQKIQKLINQVLTAREVLTDNQIEAYINQLSALSLDDQEQCLQTIANFEADNTDEVFTANVTKLRETLSKKVDDIKMLLKQDEEYDDTTREIPTEDMDASTKTNAVESNNVEVVIEDDLGSMTKSQIEAIVTETENNLKDLTIENIINTLTNDLKLLQQQNIIHTAQIAKTLTYFFEIDSRDTQKATEFAHAIYLISESHASVKNYIYQLPLASKCKLAFREYELKHILGQGGYGSVFEITKKGHDEPEALKIIDDSIVMQIAKNTYTTAKKEEISWEQHYQNVRRDIRRTIAQERLTLTELHKRYIQEHPERSKHPHIIDFKGPLKDQTGFIDPRATPEKPRLVGIRMKKVAHGDIENYTDNFVLTPPQQMQVMENILDALTYSHKWHIIHRDMKPSNILADTEDNQLTFKLTDFGMNTHIKGINNKQGERAGSLPYLHPDQALGFSHEDELIESHIETAFVHDYDAAKEKNIVHTHEYEPDVEDLQAGYVVAKYKYDWYGLAQSFLEITLNRKIFSGDPQSVLFNKSVRNEAVLREGIKEYQTQLANSTNNLNATDIENIGHLLAQMLDLEDLPIRPRSESLEVLQAIEDLPEGEIGALTSAVDSGEDMREIKQRLQNDNRYTPKMINQVMKAFVMNNSPRGTQYFHDSFQYLFTKSQQNMTADDATDDDLEIG